MPEVVDPSVELCGVAGAQDVDAGGLLGGPQLDAEDAGALRVLRDDGAGQRDGAKMYEREGVVEVVKSGGVLQQDPPALPPSHAALSALVHRALEQPPRGAGNGDRPRLLPAGRAAALDLPAGGGGALGQRGGAGDDWGAGGRGQRGGGGACEREGGRGEAGESKRVCCGRARGAREGGRGERAGAVKVQEGGGAVGRGCRRGVEREEEVLG